MPDEADSDAEAEDTWGPEYTTANAEFYAGPNGHFFHDEVYDFLFGEMQGERVFPSRLRGSEKEAAQKANFVKNLRKSYTLRPNGQCLFLYHEVRPANRTTHGIRRGSFGWKVVVTKDAAAHVVARDHMLTHNGGNRMVSDLNRELSLPDLAAKSILRDVKARCPVCEAKGRAPKNLPHTPILSSTLGERILIDLKKLGSRGYLAVSIDHHTSLCWAKHLETKDAGPVAVFVQSVFDDITAIRGSWAAARREAEMSERSLPPSRPANDDDDVIEALLDVMEFNYRVREETPKRDETGESVLKGLQKCMEGFERSTSGRVRVFQSDHGTEFRGQVEKVVEGDGRVRMKSQPFSPRENGKVERKNKSLGDKFYAMASRSGGVEGLSFTELNEVAQHAVAIENHSNHKDGHRPCEAAWRRKGLFEENSNGFMELKRGDAMTALEVLEMYHGMSFRQARFANFIVKQQTKHMEQHHAEDTRNIKVGSKV